VNARPTVSVIVPFAGSEAELARTLTTLGRLELSPTDELIVALNEPLAVPPLATGARVVEAFGVRAPGYARNRGASVATGEWLVLLDADTEPEPHLLARYFAPLPSDDVAVLAGEIVALAEPGRIAGRYSVARRQLDQQLTLVRDGASYAQTANCAIRRAAFVSVGGFDETARAGEDADLCFRLMRSGWGIERRPAARAGHRSRSTVPALLAQMARHGSGAQWLNGRYPGEFPPPSPRRLGARLAREAGAVARAAAARDRDRAGVAVVGLLATAAFELGRLAPNRARPPRGGPGYPTPVPSNPRTPREH
jgi:hypothetical protein